jgi:hypothetical protein
MNVLEGLIGGVEMNPFCILTLVVLLVLLTRLILIGLEEGFKGSCGFLVFTQLNGDWSLVFTFKLDLESDTLPPSYIFLLAELEVDTNGD